MPKLIEVSETEALHLVLPLVMWLLSEKPESDLILPRIMDSTDPQANTAAVTAVLQRICDSRGVDMDRLMKKVKEAVRRKEATLANRAILDAIVNRI